MPTRAPFQPLQGLPLSKTDRAFGEFVTRGLLAARMHRPRLPTLRSLVSLLIATFHLDGVELCGFDERVDGSIMLWLEPEFWSLKPKPRKIASLEQFHGISGR